MLPPVDLDGVTIEPLGTIDRDELVRDIEQTRARLASTADALAAKADVKGQAQAKVEDLKVTARHKVADVRQQATAKVH